MSVLERIREHPARFLIPNAMTVARPVLGWQALRAARSGDWKKAQVKNLLAWISDAEGSVARPLNATTPFGAMLDPVADGILRFEMALTLAPHFNNFWGILTTALEIQNIAINKKVQESPLEPIIPKGAKNGTAVEGAGVVLFMRGVEKDSEVLKTLGEITVTVGALMRNASYRTLRMETRRSNE